MNAGRRQRRRRGALVGAVAGIAALALAAPAAADVEHVRSIPVSSTVFTLDSSDDILVARNGAIDRYSSTGTPETGFTTSASYTNPSGLEFAGGRLWSATSSPSRVWTWLPNGTDEAATSTATLFAINLNTPRGLAVGGGSVYIGGGENRRVTLVSTSPLGQSVVVAGVAVASGGGDVFEVCQPTEAMPVCGDGKGGAAAQYMNSPGDIDIGSVTGRAYIAETGIDATAPPRIKVLGAGPAVLYNFGGLGEGAGQFESPSGIAVDAAEENVFVSDLNNHRVMQFTTAGAFVQGFGYGVDTGAAQLETCTTASGCQVGLGGNNPGQLNFAGLIDIDSGGDLHVMSPGASRIDVFSLDGAGPAEKSLALDARPARVKKGRKTTLTATLDPCPATSGQPVVFERFKDGAFTPITAELGADGECAATHRQKVKRNTRFRATSPAAAGFGAAVSEAVTVKIRRDGGSD